MLHSLIVIEHIDAVQPITVNCDLIVPAMSDNAVP